MKRYWIQTMMALSVLFSIKYLAWRLGYSLNADALWFAVPLLLAEIHGFIETSLYFFMVWDPTKRTSLPPLENRTVDVLVPTFGEPLDLLRATLIGCNDMTYPHTTYVCDDGGRSEVKALAEELGCLYITRKERKGAKAGNLNNALKSVKGEFLVTLDADHVPLPSLIDEAIGFFADDKVALVQMPQEFYNLDSFQHSTNWKRGRSWHEQELFYSVIQSGKDRWNAAFYCGSTTIIRRSAIDQIGGFAEETVTEDIHTALRLQASGWRSVYYNKTMARGLAPNTFHSFAVQRLRWGKGAMNVWKIDNPLTMKGLTLAQRLNYFASMYTYFDGFQKLVYLLTPIIILTTGILPIHADPVTFLGYFVPYFVTSVYAISLTQGGIRGTIKVEQYNLIKLINQIKAVVGGLFKREEYKVTPKSHEVDRNPQEVVPLLVLVSIGLIVAIKGVVSIALGDRTHLWAQVASIYWASFYAALLIPMTIQALRKTENRKAYRFDGRFDVAVEHRLISVMESAVELTDARAGSKATIARAGSKATAVAPIASSTGEAERSEATAVLTSSTEEQGDANTTGDVPGNKEKRMVYARNLSPYGCSITIESPYDQGSLVDLTLHFPDTILETVAEVKRSTPANIKGEDKYIVGLEFANLDTENRDRITRFLLNVAAVKQSEFLWLGKLARRKES